MFLLFLIPFFYDEDKSIQPLPLVNKLILQNNDKNIRFFKNPVQKIDVSKHKEGFIASFQKEEEFNDMILLIKREKLEFYQVYNRKGIEIYFPAPYKYYIKPKKHITQEILIKRLKDFYKLDYQGLEKKEEVYELTIKSPPYDPIILDNMFAEDHPFIEWSRLHYEYVSEPFLATSYLKNAASENIDFLREFIVEITLFSTDITLPDQFIPVMGRDFRPISMNSTNQDVLYEFFPHKVIKDKNVIKIIYPFKFYATDLVNIRTVIRLLDKDQPKLVTLDSTQYFNSSLLTMTKFTDILGLDKPIQAKTVASPVLPAIQWYEQPDFCLLSNILFYVALSITIVYIGSLVLYYLFVTSFYLLSSSDIQRLWKQTLKQKDYKEIYKNLLKIAKFYEIDLSKPNNYGLNNVMNELNKIYQKNVEYDLPLLRKELLKFKKSISK